ncbi:DUF1592 domain-containing protein [Pirellulaceae bacterium SH449]
MNPFFTNVSLRCWLALRYSWLIVCLVPLCAPCAVNADDDAAWAKWRSTYESRVLPIIKAKCSSCHNEENAEGELNLAKFENGDLAQKAGDMWERVAKRVRQNEMPPPDSPGLNDREKSAFHRWVDSRPREDLCDQIATDETQSWYRGYVMSRRLSRYEYGNAIYDLVGLRLSEDDLPPEDGAGGEGFDTAGDSLFTSSIHLEAYMRASDQAATHWLASHRADLDRATDIFAEWIEPFAKRAWRRPLVDVDRQRLRQLYDVVNQQTSSPERATKQTLMAVILSPNFLFLVESDSGALGVQRLSPHQFAARMAILVWSSIPDEALLEAADQGTIFEPEVIKAHLRRMLDDPRSRALGENFGLQWLGLRDFLQTKPDSSLYPDYTLELARDAQEETIRFIANVFQNDRPLTDLIDAEYTFLSARLAQHYGIDYPEESDWQQVGISQPVTQERGGILTMVSTLTKSSYPGRTSPVLRGRWILEDILGSRVPPPPPNVPALEEVDHAEAQLTLREKLELHRQKPECASCHDRMDPLGFGLENYDAIGRWRTEDNGLPLDTRGTLPSGESFNGPLELKRLLLSRKDEFQRHFVRKMTGFAMGRELNKFDQCIIDRSMQRLNEEQRASVILEEILLSYAFQHRYFH